MSEKHKADIFPIIVEGFAIWAIFEMLKEKKLFYDTPSTLELSAGDYVNRIVDYNYLFHHFLSDQDVEFSEKYYNATLAAIYNFFAT
jgi:hypothetical protein